MLSLLVALSLALLVSPTRNLKLDAVLGLKLFGVKSCVATSFLQ